MGVGEVSVRRLLRLLGGCVLCGLVAVAAASAEQGDLDTSFGSSGQATVGIGPVDRAMASDLAPDGKLVVVGTAGTAFLANDSDAFVLRLNANGTIDSSFGGGDGKVTLEVGDQGFAWDVEVQEDGKIVLVASGTGVDGWRRIMRLAVDGSPDPSFSGDGTFPTNEVQAQGLALQPDGKILFSGCVSVGAGCLFGVARLLADGSALDTGFAGTGVQTIDFPSTPQDAPWDVAVASDGKVVVAGEVGDDAFTVSDVALARLTTGGALDSSFDGDGRVVTSLSASGFDGVTDMALQADGKPVLTVSSPSLTGFALVRYTSSGAPDSTFDSDGIVTTDFDATTEIASAIVVQGDQRITVTGLIGPAGARDIALARYLPGGTLDTSFSGDGKLIRNLGASEFVPQRTLEVRPDGRILVASSTGTGGATVPGSQYDLVVARFQGWLDPASLGYIRAVTTPGGAVPGNLILGSWWMNQWATDWVKVPPGLYPLRGTAVEGFDPPISSNVNVSAGDTSTVSVPYTTLGNLRVILSPPVASTISIDGVRVNDWNFYAPFPPGAHQVCFGPVAGFDPPPCQNVQVAANRALLTTVNATFTPNAAAAGEAGVGYLRVAPQPSGQVPTTIFVNSQRRNQWALDWLKLPPGTYTLSFSEVEGYRPPSSQQVQIVANQVTEVSPSFSVLGNVRVRTTPALPATLYVDGNPANDWQVWTPMPAGQREICFGFASGFVAPPCQTINVPPSRAGLIDIQGTYTPT